MSLLYAGPPIDDIRLQEQAQDFVDALQGDVATKSYCRELSARYGIDLASQVLYRSILAASPHREFAQTIDAYSAAPNADPLPGTLLIVPAMHYRERPELGGNGEYIASIAARYGFTTRIIPIQSRGHLLDNARAIADALAAHRHEPIDVVSVSKGGPEFRLAWQGFPDRLRDVRLRTWVNICGPVHGARLADHFLSSTWRSLQWRMICAALGVPFRVLEEMRPDHPFWHESWQLPQTSQVINVVGIAASAYVRRPLVARYRALSSWGPNDGVALTHESIYLPGLIYPLWGSDHFLRTPHVSQLLYRLFGYLRDQVTTATTAGRQTATTRAAAPSR